MAYLTLADYAASPKPLVAGVAKALQDDSMFMDSVQFPTVASMAVKVIREGALPTVSWRNLGASHSSNKAQKPNEVQEQAYSIGNYIDVDKTQLKDTAERFYDPRAYQTAMVTRAISREFSDAVINGTPATSNKPVGLFYRVMNDLAAAQRVDAGSGSGLDISPDSAALSANGQQLLDRLDAVMYAMPDHKADALLMNATMLQRIWSIARQANVLSTTQDSLGREIWTYKGAKFIDMGYKIDDSTKVITDVELANGTALSGGASTSVYAVRLGTEFFTPWQMYDLDVNDKGELDDGVTFRTVIDWTIGVALSHPRSVARLYGLIAA